MVVMSIVAIFGLLVCSVGLPNMDRGRAAYTARHPDDCVVSVGTVNSPYLGTGFYVAQKDDWAYVATARHVAEMVLSQPLVNDTLSEVVAISGDHDLALLRHRAKYKVRLLRIGDVYRGQSVTAWGFPGQTGSKRYLAEMHGWISCLNINGYVEYNGGTFPGMSGGPVTDQYGAVVGVLVGFRGWGPVPVPSSGLLEPGDRLAALLEKEVRNASR